MKAITLRRELSTDYIPFSIDVLHIYEYTGIIDIEDVDLYIKTNFIHGHSKNYKQRILSYIYGYDDPYEHILITEDSYNYNDVRIKLRDMSIDKILL